MDEEIEISVIIPVFNRVDLLINTLDSVKNQTFENFEVLLIDDGSDSKNRKRIFSYFEKINDSRFKLIDKPKELLKGGNSSRNYGFKISRGRYVKWFDSDDIMCPDFLEVQLDAINRTNFDGILANCGIYNEDFSIKLKNSWRRLIFSETPIRDYLKTQLAWQTGAGLWKKSSIENISPFSETLNNAQEWIFHFKVLTSNFNLGVIEKELFKVRSHPNSISKNKNPYYLENRFKARVIALERLYYSRNSGKRYLLKSLSKMFFNRNGAKLKFLEIILKNSSLKRGIWAQAKLEKIRRL